MESLQTYWARYTGMTANGTLVRVGMAVEASNKAGAEKQLRAHGKKSGCVEFCINQLVPRP